ncbi:hypothetical protein FK531_09230 [Rhodococcus spelaei]|uniref:DUF4436 domain-containing protein n=1 Tax=Rhodococcus spelaei TaxID=2546320 RepID=A0A541BMT6_9NOCA|nr:hypothetical protein [Rhodococcus spelaei]TQF73642.1 hypothetical protein FK531_09230 [Rhodococcus spelaei]
MKHWCLAVLTALAFALTFAGPAHAEPAPGSVQLSARINDQGAGDATAAQPVRLDPSHPAHFSLTVSNGTAAPVLLRRIDFAGHVVGLSFYSYSTAINLSVAPAATETVSYALDMSGLDGQATGLIGSTLTAVDDQGHVAATLSTVVDVRGSLLSVYGLFGLALLILTALAIADSALAIARHRLSPNRWRRGTRLLTPGIGIGLVLVFTGSVARWWVPNSTHWLLAAALFAVVFFFIGYLSPTPDRDDELDADELASEPGSEGTADIVTTALPTQDRERR